MMSQPLWNVIELYRYSGLLKYKYILTVEMYIFISINTWNILIYIDVRAEICTLYKNMDG